MDDKITMRDVNRYKSDNELAEVFGVGKAITAKQSAEKLIEFYPDKPVSKRVKGLLERRNG